MKINIQTIVKEVLKSSKFSKALDCGKVSGLQGSLKSLFIAYLSKQFPSICVITPWADDLADDIRVWSEVPIYLMPSWDESAPPPPEIISDIFSGLYTLLALTPGIVVTSPRQNLPTPKAIQANMLSLKVGGDASISMTALIERLGDLNFTRVGTVEDLSEFAVRGGLVDCWPHGRENPLRIEFMGDEIASIREFDPLLQTSIAKLEYLDILPVDLPTGNIDIKDYISKETLLIFDTLKEETSHTATVCIGEGFDAEARSSYQGNIKIFQQTLEGLKDYKIFILCENEAEEARIAELFGSHNLPDGSQECDPYTPVSFKTIISKLSQGFILPDIRLAVFAQADIFGQKRRLRIRHPFKGKGIPLEDLRSLQPGDFVVHMDYGIGIYQGLKRLKVDHTETDCLLISYKDDDKLYVPIDKFRYVERYVGHYERPPALTALGSGVWERQKKRTRKAIRDLTQELLELYAKRQILKGYKFSPDTAWQAELEASFPYEETADQLKVISEIKRDMESMVPMDRLVCGEVGYGKTEVALRLAFKAVMDSKQVAVLCPTTILTEQHLRTFRQRLAAFPVEVEMLSRFRTKSEQHKILERLERGTVDIVIGTHRLLSNDVKFKDLGVLIIDEEHRFGVQQKEKIKHLRKSVDILSLTATPIPRTLYMSLTKIRNFSSLETPPKGRLSIVTQVSLWDERLIERAILHELQRGGQVYFVHNRIRSIYIIANIIQQMNPLFKVGIAHAELSERQLEAVMLKFLIGEINVLVCTAIIGSGIDIPQVNTIILNRADRFGLADLHQLRGRVGRSNVRAYCYLIIPRRPKPEARKRLQAVAAHSELGSGFQIALRDLELKGAGNLLGREQHGHIHTIGYDLYTKLLEEEIKVIKGEDVEKKIEPVLSFDISCYIPDTYVDPERKLGLYKRLSCAKSLSEIKEFKRELIDRFGPLPEETKSLLLATQVKVLASRAGITKVIKKGDEFLLNFSKLPHKFKLKSRWITDIDTTRTGVEVSIKIKTLTSLKNFLAKIKT